MEKQEKKQINKEEHKTKKSRSILFRMLVAFIFFSIFPVIFSTLLMTSSYQEVIEKISVSEIGQNSEIGVNQDLYVVEQNIRIQIILVIVLTIILAAFTAILISRSLMRPVRQLINGTKAIAAGNLGFKLNIKSPPAEISELAYSFDQMAHNLRVSRFNLKAERDRTRMIIQHLADGLVVVDKKMRLNLINPKAEEILGFKERLSLGVRIDKKMLADKRPYYQNLAKVVMSPVNNDSHSKYSSLDKIWEVNIDKPKEINLRIFSAVIGDEQGKVFGTMRVLHDITREKEMDRMKTEFISIAAHQLRTPLSAIKWIINMVLNEDVGKLNKEQRDLLFKSYKSNERIIRLVNDLLNVSRIEEGRFGYRFDYYDFNDILKIVFENLEREVTKNNLELKLYKPKKLPKIYMDKERMLLVLQNLLDNAVKYTPEYGKIDITFKIDGDFLWVSIKDSGIGIPTKDKTRLFTKFFRADNVIRMQTEGTGMGLFIAKNIIASHGGKIDIASEEGKGTEVSFSLPLKAGQANVVNDL